MILTEDEVIKILKFLNNYYQQRFQYPKPKIEESRSLQKTWLLFLKEYDYKVVATILQKLVIEKEWPPTPGDILKEIHKIRKKDRLSADEAWETVINAISKHSYTYNPNKVKDALPNTVLRAAQIVGLAVIAEKGGDTYIRNSFIKTYERIEENRDEIERLPKSVRKNVKQLAEGYTYQIEGGKDNNE